MASFDTSRTHLNPTGIAGRIGAVFTTAIGGAATWNDARLTRNALSKLTDRELDDIGLSRADINNIK
ncbi:protein of unknown function [Salinihabitans flavidus]|uniref:YjiS-like domain-containing protein n=1 Tax=Salinihabitans flavidus TaxID=569882 RepID=A0A1H8NKQ2_9RHOB|nr:DUF1127 domain-containing protein [Salinihabitans flavidus]SEO30184.1 protein of unknown function [Salinihabitans flavidus]